MSREKRGLYGFQTRSQYRTRSLTSPSSYESLQPKVCTLAQTYNHHLHSPFVDISFDIPTNSLLKRSWIDIAMADGPGTLSPLPLVLAMGLRPVTALAFLSFISSTALFIYLTCRLVSWARHKHPQDTPNQFFLLFYNLLFADVIQSIAFFLNVHSLIRNAIEAGNSLCWAQGWFLSTGDLASSAFISTIALHTFWTVVMGRKVSYQTFYWAVGGVWGFVYAMAIIGVVLHPHDFFVRAGAWVGHFKDFGNEQADI